MSREPLVVEWSEALVDSRPGHRLMVVLRAPGCAWAAQGGCSNCPFPAAMGTREPVAAEDLVAQLEVAAGAVPSGDPGPVTVELMVSGSFLNPGEVPEAAQALLARRAAAIPGAARLLVESRPEYVEADRVRRLVAAAAGVPLAVGVGLETADDRIRQERIRKGFTWEQFEQSARVLAAAGAELLVYVLLKPIATAEGEALEDAVATAARVFALGRELSLPVRVALQPCFVARGTPLAEAFVAGRYRPPWLWSVVEVVRRAAPLGPLQVGLSDEGLDALCQASNCARCSSRVRAALAAFNAGAPLVDLDRLDCDCRAVWRREVEAG